MKPYQLSVEQAVQYFKTDKNKGLSPAEAQKRLAKMGRNVLPDSKTASVIVIFLRQFKDPLIYLLVFAAAIIFFVGTDKRDAFIVSGVLVFNAIIGAIQEGRAYKILEELKRFVKTTSVVVRDGKKDLIDHALLVVGDVVLLQEGQQVPADVRIIDSNNLNVNEAALTGESTAVHKIDTAITGEVPIADQKNMAFKGTYILAGSATAIVVATGLATEIGRIHRVIEGLEVDMPLKREMARLSYWILVFVFIACTSLFIVGLLAGRPMQELLISLTALFICVVPEGLPVALTLVLATGVYRMAKHNVLARNLHAVEGLGRTDVIVIDKTGTLTRNEMMVVRAYTDGTVWKVTGQGYHDQGVVIALDTNKSAEFPPQLLVMGSAASLLNSSEISYISTSDNFDIKGDPTEAAMFIFSKKLGIDRGLMKKEYTWLCEVPFDSQLRYHAGFYKKGDKVILFMAGAPETIFALCSQIEQSDRNQLRQFLDDGLRVVAFATKEFKAAVMETKIASLEQHVILCKEYIKEMQFLGVVGIQDVIRNEVFETVKQSKEAGLRIVMATGDHKATALYVAKRVGIFQPGDLVLLGAELEALADEQALQVLDKVSVYARVSPEHKLRIIELFHKKNKIVAMTGDGINDAPSLVASDLGIAMGRIGTEVAKQAADLVLLDDSFVSIIKAIEQGRHIFYTLQRVVLYFFATNFGEILIIFFALLVGLPLPITAAQILWLNLITDGFLDMAISTEPQESGMLKDYVTNKAYIVNRSMLYTMLFMALPMAVGSFLLFQRYYLVDLVKARTMTLVSMALFQWFNAWNCRSMKKSILQLGLFTNVWLLVATVFVLLLQLLLLHVPFLQGLFKTVPLTVYEWGTIVLLSSSILIADELRKLVLRRWYR